MFVNLEQTNLFSMLIQSNRFEKEVETEEITLNQDLNHTFFLWCAYGLLKSVLKLT